MWKYLKWVLLIVPNLLMDVLAYLVSPFIAAYSLAASPAKFLAGVPFTGWNILYWPFLTYDNPIDGDRGHLERWPIDGSKWTDFKRRTAWLWRNKAYNFAYYVCGVTVIGKLCKWYGNEKVESDMANRGWQLAIADDSFCYFAYFKYPWSKKWGIRIYVGWKYKNRQSATSPYRAMMAMFFSPWWDDDSIK